MSPEDLRKFLFQLAHLELGQALPIVETAYRIGDVEVKLSALVAASILSTPKAVRLIRWAAEHEPDLIVRSDAIGRLGVVPGDHFDFLKSILFDFSKHKLERDNAVESVAYIFDDEDDRYKEAMEALLAALDDPSPTVRFTVCFVLGNLGESFALPRLRKVAETDHARCHYGYVDAQAQRSIEVILGETDDLHTGACDGWDWDNPEI